MLVNEVSFAHVNSSSRFQIDVLDEWCPNEVPTNQTQILLESYIVEQMDKVLVMDVQAFQAKSYFVDLQSKALICQFYDFWLRLEDLYQWVYPS